LIFSTVFKLASRDYERLAMTASFFLASTNFSMLIAADFISISGIFLSLFLLFFTITKKEKCKADFFLSIWIAVIALHMGFLYLSFHQFVDEIIWIQSLGQSLPVLHGPLVYCYVLALTRGQIPIQAWLFSIVVFLFYVLSYVFLFSSSFLHSRGLFLTVNQQTPMWGIWLGPLSILITGICLIGALVEINAHKRNLKDAFSSDEKLSLTWLKYYVVGFLSGAVFMLGAFVLENNGYLSCSCAFLIVCSIFLALLIVLGYYGIRQASIFIENKVYEVSTSFALQPVSVENGSSRYTGKKVVKYRKSRVDPESLEQGIRKLERLMIQKKCYLDPDFSMNQLSIESGLPIHHLSQVINEGIGTSFFDWISSYRVQEVQSKLVNPSFQHLSILGIAYDSGFKAKSSFNKAFKKISGTTPSNYRKKYSQSAN